ncbi:MAG: hypothetical protein EKK55_24325 [Rhodocyclaceae bacterium]|nr:MAG: hypothetical protein EKK55_24325 [Rhodocyclaceae bacterium]
MSYSDAIDSLIERITKVAVTFDAGHPFHTHEDDAGEVVDIEAIPDDVTRVFDLRMVSAPEDAGGSGFGLHRFRVAMQLRVRYMAHPRGRVERQIGHDVPRLINALIHPAHPVPWRSIDTIEPPGRPELMALTNGGADAAYALVIRVPFTMHFIDRQED